MMTTNRQHRDPVRNRAGDMIYGSFRERPQPDVHLSLFYRALQVISGVIAIGLPIYFMFEIRNYDGQIPVHFDFEGNVTRTGPAIEAIISLVVIALCVLGLVILARYPRIMNYPVMLNERNVQHQYRYAMHLMIWVGVACAGVLVVMTFGWLAGWSMAWMWLPMAVMFAAMGYYVWRMFTTP